ncbi:lipocalin family protein [Asticcacaulis biprosthecium]|nr:lipocalin family protein [Asticcacaulis biprosthecium]
MFIRTALLATSVLILSACTTVPEGGGPATAQVPMSHYSGTWLEIARRPMWLTDGCVAGYSTYTAGAGGAVAVEDGCRKDTPDGKLKTIRGKGTIEDFGSANAKMKVEYPLFITWHYWVLYEAPDNSWFISADPKMKNLWIYARKVPSEAERAVMVSKAQELGYDTTQLEFPAF